MPNDSSPKGTEQVLIHYKFTKNKKYFTIICCWDTFKIPYFLNERNFWSANWAYRKLLQFVKEREASCEALGPSGRAISFVWTGTTLGSILASWKKRHETSLIWFLHIYSYAFTIILQPHSECFRTVQACCILGECPPVNLSP